jgi:hypothetical protein
MQRFLDGAAFLSLSLPRLFTFQKTEHSMCVIDGMNFFGMEPGTSPHSRGLRKSTPGRAVYLRACGGAAL